jgi:hypothetical protein
MGLRIEWIESLWRIKLNLQKNPRLSHRDHLFIQEATKIQSQF